MSTSSEWRVNAQVLGVAFFKPIALDREDLEAAGVYDVDESIAVGFRVLSLEAISEVYEADTGTCARIEILYERGAKDFIATLECNGTEEEICERLRTGVLESYEKAREELVSTG